jgi:hypothetical protein
MKLWRQHFLGKWHSHTSPAASLDPTPECFYENAPLLIACRVCSDKLHTSTSSSSASFIWSCLVSRCGAFGSQKSGCLIKLCFSRTIVLSLLIRGFQNKHSVPHESYGRRSETVLIGFIWPRVGTVAGSCEGDNEASCFIRSGNVLTG